MKKELRREIIKKRDKLDCMEKAIKDKKIIEKLKDTKEYKEAKGIFVYIGFGSEINTKILIEDALKDGKEVYVPKVIKKEMVFIKINSLENLVTSSYGILEPVGDKSNFNVDNLGLIVMPGLAFDKQGNRLGYGGGYYDRFLSNIKDKRNKIVLAYNLQIVDNIEAEEHDIKVDYIITNSRINKIY